MTVTAPSPVPVKTHRLTKQYGSVAALDGVTLELSTPGLIGLLGHNGSGKSTLLRMVSGRQYPSAGDVRVLGAAVPLGHLEPGSVCCMMESQSYPGAFRVRDVVASARGVFPRWDAAWERELLEAFRLPAGTQVKGLSRGMRSALSVVIGFASGAPVTCLDEPCVGLDVASRRLFYDNLDRALQPGERTFVVATHLIDEIASRLDHVLVLREGRVLVDRPADELRRSVVRVVGDAALVDSWTDHGATVIHRRVRGGTHDALLTDLEDADVRGGAPLEVHTKSLTLTQVLHWTASNDDTAMEDVLR